MANAAKLAIEIVSDSKQARQEIGGMGDAMGKLTAPAAVAGAAVAKLGYDAIQAASEAEQSSGAMAAVFGDATAQMKGYAEQASTSAGLSEAAYSQMAAVIGSQLGNMGIAQDEVAGTTNNLIGLGADLAAQFGGSTSDAVAALSSLMRGERDPIEQYGVSIKQADIEAQKAAMGLSGLTGEADKQAETQATLALLTQQTASAQGAFARETNTAAGAQQIATAEWDNAKAALGQGLLPIVTAGAQKLADFARWVQQNSTVVLVLVGVIGTLAGVVLGYQAATMAARTAMGVAAAAQWLWNAAMTANPIGLIIAGIAALIAIIVLLVRNWDTVRATAQRVFQIVGTAARAAGAVLRNAWNSAISAVRGWFSGLGSHINGIVSRIVGWFSAIPRKVAGFFNRIRIPSWITKTLDVLGFSAPAAQLVAAPATFATNPLDLFRTDTAAPSRPAQITAVPKIEINVTGALDPRAVARQIRDILNTDARLGGRVAMNGRVI